MRWCGGWTRERSKERGEGGEGGDPNEQNKAEEIMLKVSAQRDPRRRRPTFTCEESNMLAKYSGVPKST